MSSFPITTGSISVAVRGHAQINQRDQRCHVGTVAPGFGGRGNAGSSPRLCRRRTRIAFACRVEGYGAGPAGDRIGFFFVP